VGSPTLSGSARLVGLLVEPTWYLVATQDRIIPPDVQRQMPQRANAAVVETAASHSVYVSQPEAVAAIIETAVKGAS
jgi:pimeloyl-ACP methyl ester carboxylesterase